jgi:DNA invertase Pin-like site-specific DNA recombinase
MAVYGYIRVSTDRQADEGESLGTQQRQIEGYAMMIGVHAGPRLCRARRLGQQAFQGATGGRSAAGGLQAR